MALEDTLEELAERRLAFKTRRARIDEEIRLLRAEKLAAEQAAIEQIIVQAVADGATMGQIKRAYGTKDHRTIADIIANRSAEIQAVRDAREAKAQAEREWFTLSQDAVKVRYDGFEASFGWVIVDDVIMFITDTPLWDDEFTTRNEAVALLDGKTETENDEAATLARAIRDQA